MKVTFGIINYNRLFYLKSCAESLMRSIKEYSDVELICVDDNSKEEGTAEYLETLRRKGWKVINQQSNRGNRTFRVGQNDVDHISPFTDALNIIFHESTGDIIFPLQGDCQFIRGGWLGDYVELFKQRSNVGSVLLDCQRRIRLESATFTKTKINNTFFAIDSTRSRINGAGDCGYRRSTLDAVGAWSMSPTGLNAEENLTDTIDKTFNGELKMYLPWVPVCAGIFTDPRGTNARVRGNKRFGKYWAAKNNTYYEWIDDKNLNYHSHRPFSIEELARPIGWTAPIDEFGNWKKNPINIENASSDDYEIIFEENIHVANDETHILDWLED